MVAGTAAVPVAANAARGYYAEQLASNEDQRRGSKQASMIGAGGGAATNVFRFTLVNTYADQRAIASSFTDGGSRTSFGHGRVSNAFSNCWWSNMDGSTSGKIGLSCWYEK